MLILIIIGIAAWFFRESSQTHYSPVREVHFVPENLFRP